jgi:hypothetical protein
LSKKDAAQAIQLLAERCEQFAATAPVVRCCCVFQIDANPDERTGTQIARTSPERMGNERDFFRVFS